MTLTPKDIERFQSYVDRSGGPDACHPWTGYSKKGTYGDFKVRGQWVRAHRLALQLSGVDVPDDRLVLHGCDVPRCCNPGHLSVGTHTQNMAERQAKGRQARGARNAGARLDDAAISLIRFLRSIGARQMDVASWFGLSVGHVSKINGRRSWR